MKRREFLKLAGSTSIVLAASPTLVGCSAISKDAANKPWHIAGSDYDDPRMRALSWAILAPNPHNRQPWLVTLQADLSLSLSIDTNKVLPETDPFNRQILIGMGCFSELLRMAAADGYKLVFDWFPDGVNDEKCTLDKRPIVNIHFKKGGITDLLFKQVLKRRSYKEPFIEKNIDKQILNKLKNTHIKGAALNIDNSNEFIQKMRTLTVEALNIELSTERTYLESIKLLRIGTDEVRENPDGINLNGYSFMLLRMLGLFTHEDAMNMTSATYKQSVENLLEVLRSTQGYLWITTANNSRLDQIDAGRSYIRVNLKATEVGLKIHPISQGLQEYAEMGHIYTEINKLVGTTSPARLQMLARIGYGEETEASPRWSLDKLIKQ